MSLAKVDRYKQEKANRKKIMAREKAGRIAGTIAAWVILIGIVGWAGFTGYRYIQENKPAQTFYCDTAPIDEYLQQLAAVDAE